MAFNEQLAARVRAAVGERAEFREQRMFGGTALMVNTHMAVGLIRDDLMVRVGPDGHDDALARGAREFGMTEGRVMRGLVMVDGAGLSDDALDGWVDLGVAWALGHAPKPAKATKAARG